MDGFIEDPLRSFFGHFLDVDAPILAGDDHGPFGTAIHHDRKIHLASDVHRLGHQHLAHQLSFRARLMGHKHLPQHRRCNLFGFRGRITEVDAPLKSALKGSFPPAASVHLGFHDQACASERFRDLAGFLGSGSDTSLGIGDVELIKKLFGLEFVNVHSVSARSPRERGVTISRPL